MFEPAIKSYDGRYLISPFGYVISLFSGKRKIVKSRLRNGYPSVWLYNSGKRKDCFVHALVAEYFIGKRLEGFQINHINGDKTDNIKFNLEYVTRSENMQHAHRIGLQNNQGENHSQSRLTEEDVMEIRKLYSEGCSQTGISKVFRVNPSAISKICNFKAWSHVKDGA